MPPPAGRQKGLAVHRPWQGGACSLMPSTYTDARRLHVMPAGLQRFQVALEAHKQWPTDELAALLAGAPLHGPPARAATSLAAAPPQPPAAEGSQAAPTAEASTASQAEPSGTASSAGASSGSGEGSSHLREHIEPGLGCLRAAVAQGLLSRPAILQVSG